MKKIIPSSLLLLVLPFQAQASTVIFSSDFESAVDNGATINDGGSTLNTKFGDPALGSLGSLSGRALILNPSASSSYEQVQLNLGYGASNYHVEFDLETLGLTTSDYAFTLLFDTPIVQNLNFADCCSNRIYAFDTKAVNPIGTLGVLSDNKLMHVNIDVDLAQSLWSIDVSGVGSGTGGFYSESGDIKAMRLSLAPALGGAGADPSVYVGIDNLVVTSVPIPGAAWLFGSACLVLAGKGLRRRS